MSAGKFAWRQKSLSWQSLSFGAGLSAIMGAALVTRLTGFGEAPIWIDEAWRANFILAPDWLSEMFAGNAFAQITSPVYLLLNRALNAFGSNEVLLRSTSLIPALIAVLLIAFVTKQVTKSRLIGVFAGLSAALSPQLYYYAKEFKPYSLELMMHMALVLLALVCAARISDKTPLSTPFKTLVALAAPLAALTAANSIFILPGYYATIGLAQWRAEKKVSREMVISCAVTGVFVVFQYVFIWSRNAGDLVSIWAANFPPANSDRLAWIWAHLTEMVHATFVTLPSPAFHSLVEQPPLDQVNAEIVLECCMGLGIISALNWRRPERFLLIVLPVIGVVLVNQFNIWPLGGVRPNVFVYGYFILIAFMGIGFATQWSPWARAISAIPLVVWLALFSFPDDIEGFRIQSPGKQQIPQAITYVADAVGTPCANRELVLAGRGIGPSMQYYMHFHMQVRARLGDRYTRCAELQNMSAEVDHPTEFDPEIAARLQNRRSAWYLWSHLLPEDVQTLKRVLAQQGVIDDDHDLGRAGAIHIVIPPATPPRQSHGPR